MCVEYAMRMKWYDWHQDLIPMRHIETEGQSFGLCAHGASSNSTTLRTKYDYYDYFVGKTKKENKTIKLNDTERVWLLLLLKTLNDPTIFYVCIIHIRCVCSTSSSSIAVSQRHRVSIPLKLEHHRQSNKIGISWFASSLCTQIEYRVNRFKWICDAFSNWFFFSQCNGQFRKVNSRSISQLHVVDTYVFHVNALINCLIF